jgi:hypothetical protein
MVTVPARGSREVDAVVDQARSRVHLCMDDIGQSAAGQRADLPQGA